MSKTVTLQDEFEKNVTFKGQIKEITGGDSLFRRSLKHEPFNDLPKFKLISTCNNLPFDDDVD